MESQERAAVFLSGVDTILALVVGVGAFGGVGRDGGG
jgi:hypothetical protein